MKWKVRYYDIDSDSSVEKQCVHVFFGHGQSSFEFTPVDNPPRIYKAVVISHPHISMYMHPGNNTMKITVVGYQYTKHGGYAQTTTHIESYEENN